MIKLSSTANHISSSSSYSPALVSYGGDKRLNVWSLEIDRVLGVIALKLLTSVTMDTCPAHMLVLNSILCLALRSNRVISLDVSASSPRLSGTVPRLTKAPGVLTHQFEDDHTETVTSLTSCPFLQLFVTTATDGRAKIWNLDNQLVSELHLGPSLSSACFATAQGDLLVGFQEHISIVQAEDFLPVAYSEVAGRTGRRDYIEEAILFDPNLEFW